MIAIVSIRFLISAARYGVIRPSHSFIFLTKCTDLNFNTMVKKNIHVNSVLSEKAKSNEDRAIVSAGHFDNVSAKDKETFLDLIRIYESKSVMRRGHVEFIYTALKHMKEFGVNEDLEVYKKLVDVLPKGRFVATNLIQAEFMHYPKQQQCITDVLEQMEDNGVIPDGELETMLINIFGRRAYPLRKYWRMMYWMPKFKNLSPWPLPKPVPNDSLELAKLAIQRIASVDVENKVSVYKTSDLEDSLDDTWIVSAQSPVQKDLIKALSKDSPIHVRGAYRVWLKNKSVQYFILRSEIPKVYPESEVDVDDVRFLNIPFFSEKREIVVQPSVHEQEDGTILSVCATGTSSRDSLLSWIRHLELDGNPSLANIPVLFTLRAPPSEVEKPEIDSEQKIDKSLPSDTTQNVKQ